MSDRRLEFLDPKPPSFKEQMLRFGSWLLWQRRTPGIGFPLSFVRLVMWSNAVGGLMKIVEWWSS